MKQFLLTTLLAAVLVVPSLHSTVRAEEKVKPVAVLSIASYDRLMTDIAFIGNLTGNPDLDKNLEGMIQLFTQGQGLAGLDRKRPLGFTLTTDGLQFNPLVVLPVENLKTLLEALAGLVGEAQDAGNGVFELDVFNQKIYVKESNKYAFLSQSPEALNELPKDAAVLFAGLDKSYDIAGRLHVQNVPEVFRTMIVDQLRVGIDSGLAKQDGESDEAFEGRRKMVEAQIETMTKAINELDTLSLGLSLDPTAKSAYIDLSVVAVAGTDTAKQMSKAKVGPSNFAGFLQPDAAASLSLTSEIDKEDAAQYVAGLEALRTQALQAIEGAERLPSEDSKKVAKEMVGEVFDAIKATFESGKIDAGATLKVSDKSLALAAGATVVDTKKLEDALKKLAKLGADDPNFPAIKFDAEKHAGISFHTASIPVPQDQNIAKVLGDKLDVAVGIGDKAVYLALGTDSLNLAKELIDKSKSEATKQLPPFQLNVALAQIFQFASVVQPEGTETDLKGMADELAKTPGKDHVRLEYMPTPNGATFRLSAEEGVLQLLGNALKDAQASGAIPGFGP